MDTRGKIVTASALTHNELLPPHWHIVRAWFDPLLAWHASRLTARRAEGRRLAVWVDDPPDPLLSAEVRAQLVAALECVDRVVTANGTEPHPALAAEDWRSADALARIELLRHVGHRHGRS